MRAKLCSAHRFPHVGCSLCGEAAVHGSADLDCLVAALEAALALHRPDGLHGERQPDGQWAEHARCWQATCPDEWPCPTYEAISAALLGESAAR